MNVVVDSLAAVDVVAVVVCESTVYNRPDVYYLSYTFIYG